MYVGRDFRFRGVDSGLLYDDNNNEGNFDADTLNVKAHSIPNGVDDDDDFIIDNAGGSEEGTDDAGWFFITPDDTRGSLIRSFIFNDTKSHLAGPEFGLDYQIGTGKRLRVSGHTKLGLLMNHERQNLSYDNIGQGTEFDVTTYNGNTGPVDLTVFIEPTDENPFPNSSNGNPGAGPNNTPGQRPGTRRSTTHVSPMFEQSLTAELRVFEYLPFFRRHRLFEQATLQAGWTLTYLGHVINPTRSIVYQGNPQANLFPVLRTERENWWFHSWNIGIEWRL